MENKNYFWRPVSEYTGGRVLATNGLDVLIGEINSEGDCESEEDGSTILCGITGFIKIEEMLPELQESEDEMIMKLLVEAVTQVLQDQYCSNRGVSKENVIAWLEKQGNLVKYYEDKLDRCACDNFNKGYKKALEKQGEQKTVEPQQDMLSQEKYAKAVDECIYGEQNPATWSEEDELRMENILSVIEGHGYPMEVEWLKSIKCKNTWKPSDEQMAALNDINLTGSISYVGQGQELISLYNDLKNLKG